MGAGDLENPAGESRSRAGELGRALARVRDQVRSALGLRKSFTVAGVRYLERSGEPLRRALSRNGPGRKEYDAVFPDGVSMRLRCTPSRVYADIAGPRLIGLYSLAEAMIRPGMRVLDLACNTGYGAEYLAELVGPSGAVVALDRDRESIRYAKARYKGANIAFEVGFVESLAGEVDGAFEGVVACDAITTADDPVAVIAELWRTVAPEGWLLVVTPLPSDGADESENLRAFTLQELEPLVVQACAGADEKARGTGGPKPPPTDPLVTAVATDDHSVVIVHRP